MTARLFLIASLALSLVLSISANAEIPTAPMGTSLCSVYGTFSNDGSNGFESLSKMIRRRFDAKSLPDCTKQIETYCLQAKQARGVRPNEMKGIYRLNKTSPESRFVVNENCSVITK